MTPFITRLVVACAFVPLVLAPVHADVDPAGDWYGVIHAPMGDLTLILTITDGENGAPAAVLESVDQAPGTKIPITSIDVTEARLTFTLDALGARYDGDWDAAEQQWVGLWKQGVELPLAFSREASARAVVEGLDGTWEGTITRNGVALRLVLRVSTNERGTVATLDSPDLGAMALPVSGFTRAEGAVRFDVPASGARFDGTLISGGGEARVSGRWTRPGRPEAVVTFVRTRESAEREVPERPQMPTEPLAYVAEDVTFDNPEADGVTLAGTLTLPPGREPFPAAILISGSGPQDRDETVFSHKPFAVLADHLTRRGIAVLRYDDRGFGESTGDHASATSADFATDTRAAVRYLLTRPEIDPGAIGLVGHSEGGMIGPIAAVDDDEVDVDFLVLLAGPGTSTIELMRSQTRLVGRSQGVSEAELAAADVLLERLFTAAATASDTEDARRRLDTVLSAASPDALDALAALGMSREGIPGIYSRDWFRYFIRYDPSVFLSRIDVPVLALNGSLDVQVPADENLAAIARALAHGRDVTVRELDGLNHLFQRATTGAIGEYADIAETFAPVAMTIVSDWILTRFGPIVHAEGP